MEGPSYFSGLIDMAARKDISRRLLTVACLIPSFKTFFADVRYLYGLSKVMVSLMEDELPKSKLYTIREMLHTRFNNETRPKMQTAFDVVSNHLGVLNFGTVFQLHYCQLWLFAMRHFAEIAEMHPRKGKGTSQRNDKSDVSKVLFKDLATALGFTVQRAALSNAQENAIQRVRCHSQPLRD